MSKLKQSMDGLNTGWAINIYGSDRRLICTLEPSHAWAFVAGIVLGGLMMLSWNGSHRSPLQPSSVNSAETAPFVID